MPTISGVDERISVNAHENGNYQLNQIFTLLTKIGMNVSLI